MEHSPPDANLLKGNLDLILLEILESQPMYGLEIIVEAQTRTNGYFDFKEGSLYPALHRLEAQGWLSADFQDSDSGGPRRKYYCLTDKGSHALERKRMEWQRFGRAIESLRGKP
jgi:PadR family transcriptional regulator, regulatory protein PadR